MISSYISIKYKLGGVNVSTSSACGTGLSSIINGCRII
jgi:3-oxoacyl-(acyl-carrier-protein) synthase